MNHWLATTAPASTAWTETNCELELFSSFTCVLSSRKMSRRLCPHGTYEERSRRLSGSRVFTTAGTFLEHSGERRRLGWACRRQDMNPNSLAVNCPQIYLLYSLMGSHTIFWNFTRGLGRKRFRECPEQHLQKFSFLNTAPPDKFWKLSLRACEPAAS